MTDRFSSVLIANRGEIACRIIRTAKVLGYRTVAVASDADRDALHTELADEVVRIGGFHPGESYLDQTKILDAARRSSAEAIHPGYGFLSENAGFARACREAGLIFIGPSPEAIELMGDKARAKRAMIAAGVPCIPGYEDEDQDEARFVEAAEAAGYPVMVKAAAGGGGRGMRIVRRAEELSSALKAAKAEAESAFGSSGLILEKAVENARHVEVQVFGDSHGTIIHLGERDCSLQRRHQKVIEEAPSPAVSEELRRKMGEAAIRAAAAVSYEGAGTVEFLLADDGSFYFLEMNTRLQVEHPVTEEVLGLDLVELQLRVAQGLPLGLQQEDVTLLGHAIEARLYAEDPAAGFLPSIGKIALFEPGEGLRTDTGVRTGSEVTPYYDSMLAKLIAHGRTREEAVRKLLAGLDDTVCFGPLTNLRYLKELIRSETFRSGEARTTTIDGMEPPERPSPTAEQLALIGALITTDQAARGPSVPESLRFFSSSERIVRTVLIEMNGIAHALRVAGGPHHFEVGDIEVTLPPLEGQRGTAELGGKSTPFAFAADEDTYHLSFPEMDVSVQDVTYRRGAGKDEAGAGAVTASMHGQLTDVFIQEGQRVEKGQKLLILEAMKMQHEITAPTTGTVSEVRAKAGTQVASGDLLVTIEIEAEEPS
ncbi:acetyl/propionyl/methylcrotonyl-CoA carboxylase subunit alpha [Parvularcula maris]|uniref:Biotin/lipoyl-binding protein n=1 Tax=Parvularcula maris TaxID=2965077 RepID=A0A9X2L9J2_9PROT|nr:biotin carboxylase N-terminal domain-containing protein [Parvularcula maris]MCQ8184657.1 biotin/lipoyl-binding protein [Parvularcula maris]